MKFFVRFFALVVIFVITALQIGTAQVSGDYRSAVNGGNWGTIATWEKFDGSTWVAATGAPGATNNVTIRNGFNVILDASGKNCLNLTIESGATFTTGVALPTSGIRYVRINGTTCTVNGTFGNPVAPGDAVAFESANNGGTVTITGSGVFAPSRVRVNSAVALGSTIIFDINTTFFYTGSSGTGGVALYPQVDNCTFTLNAGKTMTFPDQGSCSLNSSVNATTAQNCTFNVYGTMDLSQPNCQLTLRASTGFTASMHVYSGGSVSVGRHLNTTTVADGGTTVLIVDGSMAAAATIDFTNPSFVVTGTGTFTVPSGATLNIGHVEGITTSGATGQIRTTSRSFSGGANYSYVGTAAQVTGNGLPGTLSGKLRINNAAGVTLSAAVTENDTLSVVSGTLDLNGNIVTFGPAPAYLIESAGNVVKGVTGVLTTTRTLTAPSGADIAGMGIAITSSADLGSTVITRGHAPQTNGTNFGIKRYFDITPTNNSGLNATLAFHYDDSELNGISPTNVYLFKSTDAGTSWVGVPASVFPGNIITADGQSDLSRWTVGDYTAPLPIQLASFTARMLSSTSVRLNWETISEINNYGFEVQRSTQRTNGFESVSTLIPGNGTTNERHSYSYTDNTTSPGRWFYRLKQIDLDGTVHFTEPIQVDVLTAIVETAPIQFTLSQNYPNPFNPSTNIKFSVEKTAMATLEVFNMLGQKVLTLFSETAEAGKFYTVKLNGEHLSSGMYLYRLESGDKSEMKKLVLLK